MCGQNNQGITNSSCLAVWAEILISALKAVIFLDVLDASPGMALNEAAAEHCHTCCLEDINESPRACTNLRIVA
jgi:hypothetical protein